MFELYLLKEMCSTGDVDAFLSCTEEWFLDPTAKDCYKQLNEVYKNEGILLTPEELALNYNLPVLQVLEPRRITKQAIQSIKDRYNKHNFLSKLYDIVEESELTPFSDMLEDVSNLALQLSESYETEEEIRDVSTMQMEETRGKKHCGLGKFDIINGGMSYGELMLIGGHRGSGKSILLSNLALFNYNIHKETTAIVSIEMGANELYPRIISMISGVPLRDIIRKELTQDQVVKINLAKAKMFCKECDEVDTFKENLLTNKFNPLTIDGTYAKLPRKDNKFFILDLPGASMGKIVATTHRLKKYNIRWLGIDYLNIITMMGANSDPLDWKGQIQRANDTKNLARMEDLKIIAPFQTSEEGAVKYAKGIEDPVDYSIIFKKSSTTANTFTLKTSKIRNGKELEFSLKIDYNTLKVSPIDEGVKVEDEDVK